jgi:hypothetical protein
MESRPSTSPAAETAMPPEGVPQIPSQYDSERGLYVAGQNSGNVINFSPNITQTVGAGGESAASEPRRIEVNDAQPASEDAAATPNEAPAPAAPESAGTGTESYQLRSLVEELREELRQEREARNQMMERLMQSLDQQNQLMRQLMDRMDGNQAARDRSAPGAEPAPAEETVPERPYDHERDGGVEDTPEQPAQENEATARMQEHFAETGGDGDETSPETPAEPAAPEGRQQRFDWEPRINQQVSDKRGDGVLEHDWSVLRIDDKDDGRWIQAGKLPNGTPTIYRPLESFAEWQQEAAQGENPTESVNPTNETLPVGNGADETREYPARDEVGRQQEEQVQEQQQTQEQEGVQEEEQDNSLRGRMRRIWDRTRYAAMWPFNRAYEYFYLAEDPVVRRRRGLGLLAAGMIVASAVTAYFAQKHGVASPGVPHAPGEHGAAGGILPGNGAPEHGPHGAEHISFIDPSEGHRRTGGVLPNGLDWGHDGSGHEIIVDNHGATVVGADQLPHGIMKANGALSDGAVSALRKAGYNVGYVPMDNVTGQNGNLYAPVVS